MTGKMGEEGEVLGGWRRSYIWHKRQGQVHKTRRSLAGKLQDKSGAPSGEEKVTIRVFLCLGEPGSSRASPSPVSTEALKTPSSGQGDERAFRAFWHHRDDGIGGRL